MDLFDQKGLRPMLIAETREPFDDPDCIYELKLGGERCLAYLGQDVTLLRDQQGRDLNFRYPELTGLHRHVQNKCILDGELTVFADGGPDPATARFRSQIGNRFRVDLAACKWPAVFTAFDILASGGRTTMNLPLMERRRLLNGVVREVKGFAVSRYLEGKGVALHRFAAAQNLEGIVAKKKSSLYDPGRRTKDWSLIRNLSDDDFVICGFLETARGISGLLLGQCKGEQLVFCGHVAPGDTGDVFEAISRTPRAARPLLKGTGGKGAVWLCPQLVCTVRYRGKTESGLLRQPVLQGLKTDKRPEDCRIRHGGNPARFFTGSVH